MKALIAALAAGLVALPVAAAAPTALAGVSDEESTIPSGGITQFHRGNGDVLFVLDRAGRWYRLGFNEGCLSATPRVHSLTFDVPPGAQRIDRFTSVQIHDAAGTLPINCRITSIRRSEAPPQIDSNSPVTLD